MEGFDWSDFNKLNYHWKNTIDAEKELTRMLADEIDKILISQLFEINTVEQDINFYKKRLAENNTMFAKNDYLRRLIELFYIKIMQDHCHYEEKA